MILLVLIFGSTFAKAMAGFNVFVLREYRRCLGGLWIIMVKYYCRDGDFAAGIHIGTRAVY